MSSLITGYEYDIFISYRQKDNKYDGWVTEFVDNLKKELEATFKEEISVYFDINPHDGLMETHDVDESLKEKLKCLIFIPIISRTYCDLKSFAWEHEFKTFVEQASKDRYGLKIKLPNGNVASRVLPVRIYDLENADIKLCESILGSVLRGIDFIYSEPGVNRPLKPDDDERINLNKTRYRNQINKVGNAIKDIITAIVQSEQNPEEVKEKVFNPISTPQKNKKARIVGGSIITLAVIILGILFVPKLINSKEQVEKSIAVLPFKLLSDEPDKQYLADGMMETILLHLSKIKDLRVLGSTTVEQYRQSIKSIETIGKELNVEYILEGNFQKYGDKARLIVQLITTDKESHIWSNEYNRDWNDILTVQSEVAQAVARELRAAITPEEKMIIEAAPTSDLSAYDFYLRGNDYMKRGYMVKENFRYAIQMFERAVEIDPEFALAFTELAACYRSLFYFHGRNEEDMLNAKKSLDKALYLAPDLKEVQLEEARNYLTCSRDYIKAVEKLKKLSTKFPNDDEIYAQIGYSIRSLGDFRKSLEYTGKAILLNPSEWSYWSNEAFTHWALREYDKSEDDLKQAIDLNPSYQDLFASILELYIKTGQIQKAEDFLANNENKVEGQVSKQFLAEIFSLKRDYDRAVQVLETLPEGAIVKQHNFYTKHLLLGLEYRLVQNNEMAIKHFGIERDFILDEINKSENDHRLYKSLGIALAGLGLKKESVEAGWKALDIWNFEINAHQAAQTEYDMARIMLMVGEYDEALTRLDNIMRHGHLSVEILKLDPFWDPVRDKEKFREIVNNTVYQVRISN